MKGFLFDTHIHTKEASSCSRVCAEDIVKRYIDGLEQAYYSNGGKEKWDEFIRVKEGASSENIRRRNISKRRIA